MTNCEFYKNSDASMREMLNDFNESDFPTIDEFLAAKHVWKPKYAVGDIVATKLGDTAMIVNIDCEREHYICVSCGYAVSTLLPAFIDGRKLDYDHLRYTARCMPESGIEEKRGRLEYKAFLDKIAYIEAQGRS